MISRTGMHVARLRTWGVLWLWGISLAACSASPGVDGPPLTGAEAGRALMGDRGCLGCHAIAGQGGNLAPPLGAEVAAQGRETIALYLIDPASVDVYPGNGHVEFTRLSREQVHNLAEYLTSLSVTAVYQGPPRSSRGR